MYSSLYSSSQIKPKGGNAQNMKDYEKLYKEFLRSKRTENAACCIEELWNQNMLTHSRSNNGWNSKSTDVRSDSNTKCKKKKKSKDSDKKYSNKASTIRQDNGIYGFVLPIQSIASLKTAA